MRLVLLPGLDGTGTLFESFVAALPPGIEPVVMRYPPDLVGGYPALEPHLRPRLPDEPFALLGESFGGPLALRLAAGRTHPVRAVILVASFIEAPIRWLPRWARGAASPWLLGLGAPAPLLRLLVAGRDGSSSLIRQTQAALAASTPAVLADRARAAMEIDATAACRVCPAPLLYLRGTRDRLISPSAVRQVRIVRPDTEFMALDAPHFVLQCAPAAAADACQAFMLRHVPMGRTAKVAPA